MPINIPLPSVNPDKHPIIDQILQPFQKQSNNSKLNDFITAVKNESFARPNRFMVVLNRPAFMQTADTSVMKLLTLFCSSATLPGISFPTTPAFTYGEPREMPYGRQFEPVTFQFYVDLNMKVKLFFDAWYEYIINSETRHVAYYDDYVTSISIIQQDIRDQDRYIVNLYEAYPKMIGSLQLDYSLKDIHRLPVTFQFKYWKSFGVDAVNPENQKSPVDFIVNTALTIYDQIKLGTGGITGALPSVYTSAGDYFNNFNNFQQTINSNLSKIKTGITTGLGKIF